MPGESNPPYLAKCPTTSENFDQDALYLIPYKMSLLKPGVVPKFGNTFDQTFKDDQMQLVIPADLSEYLLIDIQEDSRSDKWLVFARKVLPSLSLKPSNSYHTRKMASWDAVLRYCNTQHLINQGNYYGTLIDEFHVPETHELCDILVEEWWTTDPWPPSMLGGGLILPGWVKSPSYALPDKFSLYCLHGEVYFPALTGVTQINGQAAVSNQVATKDKTFPATEPITWKPRVDEDSDVPEDGRFHRKRETVFPPFDPLTYPRAPY